MSDDKTVTDKTITKTLWSETLIEILIEALKRNKGDAEIGQLLKEIRGKGFKRHYVIEKVEKSLDAAAASRIRRLMGDS
jgi:hypothetical protein